MELLPNIDVVFKAIDKVGSMGDIGVDRVRQKYEPLPDYGFFGPGSVAWKVWCYPSSAIMGFQRSVTIEFLDPNLNASVVNSGGVKSRPRNRYERTMRYFALVAAGDTAAATKAADILVKVHSLGIGNDPVTGGRYDSNSPESQLWIHMTAWHSILYCYEMFGPGKLPAAEEAEYWEQCAIAAQCQTINPDDVPRTREAVVAYFESWKPRLAASQTAQSMVRMILHTEVALPQDQPEFVKPIMLLIARFATMATISTYPQYIRQLFGLKQSAAEDAIVQPAMRALMTAINSNIHLYDAVWSYLVPGVADILMPAVLGIPATNPVTMTPREAQKLYGYDPPAEAHLDLRRKQEQKVFGEHVAPSLEGLEESEEFFGHMRGVPQ
ncbi:oxygenase MpaB family protein [Nocardioides sp. WS12]|uniref:oxygenase MpaB family protein n=1 Tax=Nocardioides sp. WS12 TaxID=2486272 RepID=UPI00191ED20B|nr:oxygenase MpaB family protein [Nocardioides sp. WS12]